MDVGRLFARTAVDHPVIEFEDRKPLICAVSHKRRVMRDIRSSTEVILELVIPMTTQGF